MDHTLSSKTIAGLVARALPGSVPSALSDMSVRADLRTSFKVRLSDRLLVSCGLEMSGFETNRTTDDEIYRETRMRSCYISVDLRAERFDHSEVHLYLPDYAERDGSVVDVDELTRKLAFDVPSPQSIFPPHSSEEDCQDMGAYYARMAEAIDWLLGRIEGDTARLDLSRARIAADGEVYDGHGKLLSVRMRLSPADLKTFIDRQGEAALHRAFLEGHLYVNGESWFEGNRFSREKVDTILDRVTGRAKGILLWPFITWDREVFANAMKPRMVQDPFSGLKGNKSENAIALLEARLGLEPEPAARQMEG